MDLEQRISDPEVIARQDEWRKLTRQHAQLSETVETFRTYKKVLAGIDEAMEVIEDKSMDEEFREMAQEELKELKPQKEELEENISLISSGAYLFFGLPDGPYSGIMNRRYE